MAPTVGGTPYAPRRRPRWVGLLFVALLVVPVAELAVIIAVGRVIGGWQTLLLLLVESALGAWLVRREGARTWRALANALQTGRMPSRELADAALVLVGGTLLLTPGFLTDVVGFFAILPPTRPIARRGLEGLVSRRLLRGFWGGPPPGGGPPPPGGGPPGPGGGAGPDTIRGDVL